MTNEEARAIMTALKQSYINLRTTSDLKKKTVKENIKAYDMSIKALETIPKYKDAYGKGWDDGAKASYEHLKMCEEEQGGDAISRQAVLDLIADYDLSMGQVVRGIHALPSVNPQEPKTDVLDKIRDEIDAHRKTIKDMADTDDWFAGKLSGHDCDIEIIDKYRESEVKE